MVDWCAAKTITADVSLLEHGGLFAPDKTYLLYGITGDMGISVCLWMVEYGARYVVLMSRNPNISSRMLDHMAGKFGADVRPLAVDITNLASLRAAVTGIRADMPPIGEVMNGAIILRDRLFQNMPWDDFAAVLAAKVAGSRTLKRRYLIHYTISFFFQCIYSSLRILPQRDGTHDSMMFLRGNCIFFLAKLW